MNPEIAIAYVILSLIAGFVGRKRLIGFWGYVLFSVLFTPVICLLFLYLASPRKA